MRILNILLFILISISYGYGTDTLRTHKTDNDIMRWTDLSKDLRILVDQNAALTVDEVFRSREFQNNDRSDEFLSQNKVLQPPFVVWSKVSIANHGINTRDDYLVLCNRADSIRVYTVSNGQVVNINLTGSALKPGSKYLPLFNNYLPLQLTPGETKTFYFKTHFLRPITQFHLAHAYVFPSKNVIHSFIYGFAWQYFYLGIMFLFTLFGIFLFAMFREWVFLYFSMIMMFFGLYFMIVNYTIFMFIPNSSNNLFLIASNIVISGLVLSTFLFISQYISLKEKLPKYYKTFFIYSLLLASFMHIAINFSKEKIN